MVVDAEVKRQLAPRIPEPKQKFDAQRIKWAKNFIKQPSQFEINKPDDYLRCMRRASSHTTRSSSASGKRDVAQLGEQAKRSISPLKVPTHQGFVADISMIQAAKAGISLSQLEVRQITVLPEDSWKWEYGKSLVPPDQINLLPTQMRKLHDWYLQVTKEEE